MLYDSLKILHILSATLLLTSLTYSAHLWFYFRKPREVVIITERIQWQTWMIIIPAAIFQVISGFSMVSLHRDQTNPLWVAASIIGFMTVLASWITFLVFLTQSQFANAGNESIQQRNARLLACRRAQTVSIGLCGVALFALIFLMSNFSLNL